MKTSRKIIASAVCITAALVCFELHLEILCTVFVLAAIGVCTIEKPEKK